MDGYALSTALHVLADAISADFNWTEITGIGLYQAEDGAIFFSFVADAGPAGPKLSWRLAPGTSELILMEGVVDDTHSE